MITMRTRQCAWPDDIVGAIGSELAHFCVTAGADRMGYSARYVVDLVARIVRVSVETMRIMRSLTSFD